MATTLIYDSKIFEGWFYYSILIFHAKHDKLQLLNFYKANPALFMLEYDFHPIITSFTNIALITIIMMKEIVMSRS